MVKTESKRFVIVVNIVMSTLVLMFLISLVWLGFTLGTSYQKKKDKAEILFRCPEGIICIVPVPGKQVLFR